MEDFRGLVNSRKLAREARECFGSAHQNNQSGTQLPDNRQPFFVREPGRQANRHEQDIDMSDLLRLRRGESTLNVSQITEAHSLKRPGENQIELATARLRSAVCWNAANP